MQHVILPEPTKFLLFDMDGTLVDTEPVGPATFLEQLRRHGVIPEPSEYDLFVKVWRRDGANMDEDEFLTSIVAKYGIKKTPKSYIDEFYVLYEQAIVKAAPLPGVSDFLAKAINAGKFKLAIVTASKLSQVQAILNNNKWYGVFTAVISEEDITRHKPDPEPFIVAIRKLDAKPAETVIFEDSKNGVLAGSASGAYVVGVKAGNAKPQDLSSASIVINSFLDLA